MPSADADQVTRFRHTSVLLEGAVDALVHDPEGVYLDGTFGRGGHSRLILSRLSHQGRLLAMDRDPQAIAAAADIDDPRFFITQREFAQLAEFAKEQGLYGKLSGILLESTILPDGRFAIAVGIGGWVSRQPSLCREDSSVWPLLIIAEALK